MRSFDVTQLLGMKLAVVDSPSLVRHVFAELADGRGGWVVTANLDILRRYVLDSDARALYDAADLRVADGMPLVWAATIADEPLPERVAGSSFALELAEQAAREGRSLYLLGGAPGAAKRCCSVLERRFPSLTIAGTAAPLVSAMPVWEEVERIAEEMGDPADIVLVGLGSPKQEYLIAKLRQRFPRSWFVGVGVTFSFVAGTLPRAPRWMQRAGVEWVHRMVHDPRRLAKRYLVDDLPFAFWLFASSAWRRARRTLLERG